jgi:hypothetical protein
LNLRPQKVISKETTTGTVIVTGSAKPISCIRIRHANFPGTREILEPHARFKYTLKLETVVQSKTLGKASRAEGYPVNGVIAFIRQSCLLHTRHQGTVKMGVNVCPRGWYERNNSVKLPLF